MSKPYLIPIKNSSSFIIVDIYYKKLENYYTGLDIGGYPQCYFNGKRIPMHKIILNNCRGNEQVDHINGNKLDNRLCNLRYVSPSLNTRNSKISKNNTSGTKGVFYCKSKRSWIAKGVKENKLILNKSFTNKLDAIKARKLFDKMYNNDLKNGGRKPIKTTRPDRRKILITDTELICRI